jgi:protein tyrosine/serine phosphatase
MRAVIILLLLAGAATAAQPDAKQAALAELQSKSGPVRFAEVRSGLYRGGQPTLHHVALLHDLGVETIIDLRSEDRHTREAEQREAERLGMKFESFPFWGPFGAKSELLFRIVAAIQEGKTVYVHCNLGRDRTSLVVALSQVMLDHWDAQRAWQRDAVDFGYQRGWWYGKIMDSFYRAVRDHASRP